MCVSLSLSLQKNIIYAVINRWCRIMNLDRSTHFNPDVLAVCVTSRVVCTGCVQNVGLFFPNVFKYVSHKLSGE